MTYDPRSFPPFAVTVDIVLFTITDSLAVLLVERGGPPFEEAMALPGGFVTPEESIDEASWRELAEETGLEQNLLPDVHLEQLATFGAVDRDPRMRVVTVAYLGMCSFRPELKAGTDARDAQWIGIEHLPELAFDHAEILGTGLERVRAKLEYTTLATTLAGDDFTLGDLHRIYETVWGVELDLANFRRKVLAIGDALGAAVEFKPPGTFPPVTGYRGGGPHRLAPGEWTDDTSMALALADSIIDVGWDLDDQAERYLRWWRRGEYSVTGTCFDIGNATRSALARYERTRNATTSGSDDEYSAGNGSIMRLAPVVIAYLDHQSLIDRCVESSLPTHRAPQCLSACAYLGAVLAALMRRADRSEALSPESDHIASPLSSGLHPAIEKVAQGSFLRRKPPEIVGSGYVVKSLEAALWAFAGADDFEDAVLRAVNLGDDADTTGAVCGQLAGAHWGASGIPDHLLNGLAWREQIESMAGSLVYVR